MDTNFQTNLKKYADLAVNVGLNLQPGQKLILQALKYGGVPIQTAPLIREIVTSAYQAGSPLVDVLWRDDDINLIRFEHAPRDSFEEFPAWQSKGILEVVENGGAMLSISAFDPDLMGGQDPELLNQQQTAIRKYWKPISTHIGKNTMNWTVLSIPIAGWARKVFPDLPVGEQEPALWDALFNICRVYEEDPIAAWQAHIIKLSKRGIPFTANVPTEEVFTLPDRNLTEGTVSSSRPLAYSGNVINNFSLTFKEGKVVDFSAEQGEQVLKNLLKVDSNASMLGEVALVPNSSPISQSGLLFYNTLLDENASCHLALGNAYQFNIEGGEKLSSEEFNARGGNSSLIHEDFMVGSGEMNIDGTLLDGNTEPVMRDGEWAFVL